MTDLDKYGDKRQRRVFCDAMERLSEDVVRMRLANKLPIGDRAEENPPPAFAIIWLIKKAKARRRAEGARYWFLAIVAVISAVAAIVAAIPVVKPWLGL
jgi:hypothetical protein